MDIVGKLQPQVNARLVPIQCEGFKSKVWVTGCDAAFHGIAEYLLKPTPKQPDLVNVITPLTTGKLDEVEIARLFGEIGLRGNFIPSFATPEDLAQSTGAAATAALCLAFGDYFARHLTEKYGVPQAQEIMPLGVRSTDQWLCEIGKLTGKEKAVEELIAREHKAIQPELAELRKVLKGKRVFISGGQARAVTLAALGEDLGFEVVGITMFHYDEIVESNIKWLAKHFGNFKVQVANMQQFEHVNLIKRLKPDLYVGEPATTATAAVLGIPSTAIFDLSFTCLGYRGIRFFGERMTRALKNPAFPKGLSRHARLPYRDAWYAQDPFKYLKEANEENNKEVSRVGSNK